MKVVFNKRFHLGRWYEAGDEAELRDRLAKRYINTGVVHPAPKPKRKKKKVASKTAKEKKSTSQKVQSWGYSRNS